jgi:hypothetical protein
MEAMTAVPPIPDFAPELTAHDRCDECGSQALVTATKGDLMLLLCGHHSRKHMDRLVATGWTTVGESW